ncbi:MAG: RES domain-containing protein [Gemmatimonadetes bacterium]|nr:RES domain-containing protein [Gemmatimonadota bacterium]
MDAYRIHDRRFHALSGSGAARHGGRWNPRGLPLVYASPSYEGSLLETLARAEIGVFPVDHVASRILLPEDSEVPVLSDVEYSDWRDAVRSRAIGEAWAASVSSLALLVPSYVAQPWGWNVVLNPRHPDFFQVRVAETVEILWDSRLHR